MKLNPFNKNKNRIDMDPKEKKTKQEEELKVDDIQDTVEGQSQIKKTNTSGSRLNLTTTANVPSKKKPN